jgi:peptide-methionine (R)-S-oxide reductase
MHSRKVIEMSRSLFGLFGGRDGPQASPHLKAASAPEPRADRLELDDSAWRARLDGLAYDVMRRHGTERPWSSPLNDEKRAGHFVCAGCGLPLFTTAMKFDSGTGWPSFFEALPGVFETSVDYKLVLPRVEYHCARCGAHHGHVFEDGPAPTGLRFCNNGVALRFEPQA